MYYNSDRQWDELATITVPGSDGGEIRLKWRPWLGTRRAGCGHNPPRDWCWLAPAGALSLSAAVGGLLSLDEAS